MRLRQLTGLEQDKLREEYDELLKTIAGYKKLLDSKSMRMDLIKNELIEIKEKYGQASEVFTKANNVNIGEISSQHPAGNVGIQIHHINPINKGEIVWQVPLGEYEELTRQGFSKTGTENYGGPILTDGGLIFIGATNDEYFRAFDKKTGEEIWKTKLPAGGYATPITYQIDNEQYILINATGSYSLKKGYPDLVDYGNSIMVFKLKK